jgi:hypothetical protein
VLSSSFNFAFSNLTVVIDAFLPRLWQLNQEGKSVLVARSLHPEARIPHSFLANAGEEG